MHTLMHTACRVSNVRSSPFTISIIIRKIPVYSRIRVQFECSFLKCTFYICCRCAPVHTKSLIVIYHVWMQLLLKFISESSHSIINYTRQTQCTIGAAASRHIVECDMSKPDYIALSRSIVSKVLICFKQHLI